MQFLNIKDVRLALPKGCFLRKVDRGNRPLKQSNDGRALRRYCAYASSTRHNKLSIRNTLGQSDHCFVVESMLGLIQINIPEELPEKIK